MRRTLNGWIGVLVLSLPLRAVAAPAVEPCRPLEPAAARREAAELVHSLRQELAPVEARIRNAPLLQQAEFAFWQAASEPPGSPLPSSFRPLRRAVEAA